MALVISDEVFFTVSARGEEVVSSLNRKILLLPLLAKMRFCCSNDTQQGDFTLKAWPVEDNIMKSAKVIVDLAVHIGFVAISFSLTRFVLHVLR